MLEKISNNAFFDLIQINSNTYCAIKNSPTCMSNSGFVDLGNMVVVFDTFLSIDAAKSLKEIIDTLLKPQKYIVINSHSHTDHFICNCAFPNATIISSNLSYPNINKQFDNIIKNQDRIRTRLLELKTKLTTATDKEEILDLKNSIISYENLSNNQLKKVNPDITFNDELEIIGDKGKVKLKVVPIAHSVGDIIMEVDNNAFLGDILFVSEHPFIGAGDPFKLRETLVNLYNKEYEYLIPGHGPIGTKDKLLDEIEYIDLLNNLVLNDQGENITLNQLPKKYQDMDATTFRWNIDYFLKYYGKDNK